MNIISTSDLASYLRDPKLADDDGAAFIVSQTNGVVTEQWASPVQPVPFWVTNLTLEVAARAVRNPQGLASWTKSIDDASKTERLPDASARAGIYLNNDERNRLRRNDRVPPLAVGSIETPVPGYTCP